MGNSGTLKLPSALVSVVRSWPVFTLRTTTLAPDTTAPDASVTVPSSSRVISCNRARSACHSSSVAPAWIRGRRRDCPDCALKIGCQSCRAFQASAACS